uniref:thiopeptide-type bacteriocin biosynthesis protein n=1 Tax=Salmonella enterica TaxID=28901 RepID=UPI0031B5E987
SKLVPYRRESYRYGGVENIELAEKCFEIDSLIVSHYYENLITKDEEHKVMFGIDNIVNILDIFGYNSNNYEDVLKYVVLKVENKNYYRKNKGRLIDSIKNNEKYMELYDIRNYRENLYSEYVKKLKSYQEVDIHKVSMSIIHMFCNRLFGTDRNTESFLLEMLSRSYKDYKNIIKFRENHNG